MNALERKGEIEVGLSLNLSEVNLVLDALGDRPFRDVFALVQKIQEQAASQMNPAVSTHQSDEEPDA